MALCVVAIWGTNFVVIRLGLDDLPPLFLAAVRFFFVVFPLVFFLKRPKVPWRYLAGYGVLIGAGQFGILFYAMTSDISPGLASLVIQSQVFFTVGLSMWLTRERVRGYQIFALLLAVAGIGVIIGHSDGATTPLGLVLVLLAAGCWGGGNIIAKLSGEVDMLAYVVWGSLFSVPPLIAASLLLEGPQAIASGLARSDWQTALVVLWQSVGNSMFGYGVWGWLMARHPASVIAPTALLVPVFGMGASALFLGEPMQDWKLAAAGLVIGGLALNLLWPMIRRRLAVAG